MGLASALDGAFPAAASEATEAVKRVAILDEQTWASSLDVRLLREWFDVTGDDGDERTREREQRPAQHEQRRRVPEASFALDVTDIIDALTSGKQRHEDGSVNEKGIQPSPSPSSSSSFMDERRRRSDLGSALHSACDIGIAVGGSTSPREQMIRQKLSFDDMATLWERLKQHWRVNGSGASRVLLNHIDLFVAPLLPGRRIQGFNCLPPPFHQEASCLQQCEQRRKNSTHECKTFLGDAPLPVEHCPGTTSFPQLRCQHDSLTPRCNTAVVHRPSS